MNKLLLFVLVAVMSLTVFGQNAKQEKTAENAASDKTARAFAEEALKAHGGDKLKSLKSIVVSGGMSVTTSFSPQSIPATFNIVLAGEKYRLEINNQFTPFKQIFDGSETYTSVQNGFLLPPVNQVGLPVLAKIGDPRFVISALPDKFGKKQGFRLTTPEGYVTDFILDKKTNRVQEFESEFTVNGRKITTSAVIDKYREIDGVIIHEKFAQRFDLGQMTAYAEFKAKDIVLDKQLDDDVFVMSE